MKKIAMSKIMMKWKTEDYRKENDKDQKKEIKFATKKIMKNERRHF